MKKRIIFLTLTLLTSNIATAGSWDFNAHGLAGAYYGFSKTKYENKYPGRFATRADATLQANYLFDSTNKIGIHASSSIIYK